MTDTQLPTRSERLNMLRQCMTLAPDDNATSKYNPATGESYAPLEHAQRLQWDAICALLTRWTEHVPDLTPEIDAAARLLTSIPATIRVAPTSWYATIHDSEWFDEWAAWTVYERTITALLPVPHPAWRLVGAISLSDQFDNKGLGKAFCTNPAMSHIVGLYLIRQPDHWLLDDTFIQDLIQSSTWANLQHIQISGHSISDTSLVSMSTWPGLSQLTALAIWEGRFSARGVAAFLHSPYVQTLHTLRLEVCGLHDEAIQTFIDAPRIPSLRVLDLRWNTFSDAGRDALARAPALQGIELLI